MASKPKDFGILDVVEAVRNSIDELREKIAGLKAARDEITSLPISKDEAMARLDNWMNNLLDPQRSKHFNRVFSSFIGQEERMPSPLDAEDDAERFYAIFMARDMRQQFAAKIDEHYDGQEGISPEARQQKTATVDKQIYALELQEEEFIQMASDRGIDIARRADFNPLVLLEAGS